MVLFADLALVLEGGKLFLQRGDQGDRSLHFLAVPLGGGDLLLDPVTLLVSTEIDALRELSSVTRFQTWVGPAVVLVLLDVIRGGLSQPSDVAPQVVDAAGELLVRGDRHERADAQDRAAKDPPEDRDSLLGLFVLLAPLAPCPARSVSAARIK